MQVGDMAHGFALPMARREIVDVGQLVGSGPIALLFIPFAFSSTCTTELCRIGRDWTDWQVEGAHVFGIAVDSPYATSKWMEEEQLSFPVLSDFSREVTRAYGVLDEELAGPPGVARRSVFVIGTDGRISYRWVADSPELEPDYDAVRAAMEAY